MARNILVASEAPSPLASLAPLKTLKRQICEEEDMVGKEMGRWWILDQNLSLTLQCFCKAPLPPPYFHTLNTLILGNSSRPLSQKGFLKIRISLLRFSLPGKWPPIVSALQAQIADCGRSFCFTKKKQSLFWLKHLSRCLVYNAIVFINFGQMMMVGSSSRLNTLWPLQYLLQIERWFLGTWT